MIKLATAMIDIAANVDSLAGDLDEAKGKFSNFIGNIGGMLGSIGVGVGLSSMLSIVNGSITAFTESERASRRLEATLRATGNAAGFSADELEDFASELQYATEFEDDMIKSAMAELTTFKSVSGDTFKRATELALDLAATGFGSVESSTIQLGKALEDPIKGMNALRKSGVSFTEEEKAKIAELVKTNRLLDAQTMVLDAVAGQVGGVARAIGQTDYGRLQQMGHAIEDIKEKIGEAALPIMVQFKEVMFKAWEFAGFLADGLIKLHKATDGLSSRLIAGAISGAVLAAGFMAASAAGLTFNVVLGLVKTALIKTGIGIAVVLVGALAAAVLYAAEVFMEWVASLDPVKEALDELWDSLLLAWDNIKIAFDVAFKALVTAVNMVGSAIAATFGVTWTDIETGIGDFVASVINWFADLVLNVSEWIRLIAEHWDLIWIAAKQSFFVFVDLVVDSLKNMVKYFVESFMSTLDAVVAFGLAAQSVFEGLFWSIVEIFKQLPNVIYGIFSGNGLAESISPAVEAVGRAFVEGVQDSMKSAADWFAASQKHAAEALTFRLSPETQKDMTDLAITMAQINAEKKKLEAGRDDQLAKLKAGKEKQGKKGGEQPPPESPADAMKAGFYAFDEFAKKMQESLFDDDKKHKAKVEGFMEADKVVQEQQKEFMQQIAENTKGLKAGAVAEPD